MGALEDLIREQERTMRHAEAERLARAGAAGAARAAELDFQGLKQWVGTPLTDPLAHAQRQAAEVDAMLVVLRRHNVTEFSGHGISVKLAPKSGVELTVEEAQRVLVAELEKLHHEPQSGPPPAPFEPPHVADDTPMMPAHLEPEQINVEELLGAK